MGSKRWGSSLGRPPWAWVHAGLCGLWLWDVFAVLGLGDWPRGAKSVSAEHTKGLNRGTGRVGTLLILRATRGEAHETTVTNLEFSWKKFPLGTLCNVEFKLHPQTIKPETLNFHISKPGPKAVQTIVLDNVASYSQKKIQVPHVSAFHLSSLFHFSHFLRRSSPAGRGAAADEPISRRW